MIGRTISHYRIVEKIGEGGMGTVYKAEDTRLDRLVALKFLTAGGLADPEIKSRFLREAKAAARLDHPNVCAVYEIDQAEGETFMAMAYLEGQTLKDRIAQAPLDLDEALAIAIQIAEGLQAAHEHGVVHRDIKSANIMLTGAPSAPGRVKILDFGLARLEGGATLTPTGEILGTPVYMSPEQALRRPVDHRTDIWSLGVLTYQMATGRLPFECEGARPQVVLYNVINEKPRPISALRTEAPAELDRIVAKAMAKKREDRYPHASDLLADLRILGRTLSEGSLQGPLRRVRFGPFEANLHSAELHKNGRKIRVQQLPFRLLALLLERPGEMVSREEIQEKLWSADTFVEFEHSLNTAVSKLRGALGDSAEKPRYIETLPRRGYRFLGDVETVDEPVASVEPDQESAEPAAAGAAPPTTGNESTVRETNRSSSQRAPRARPLAWGSAAVAASVLAAGLIWWLTPSARSPRPSDSEPASIAVLPLENVTGDPEQEYFADGMTDAVIADLAQIPGLRVISRTSVMQYKQARKPLAEIARELDVGHVIEGSVARSQDRVRITVQLIEAATDTHVWAQDYERDLGDVLELQGAVAQAIAEQVRVQLTSDDKARISRRPRVDPKAYEDLLKGYHHAGNWTPEEFDKGREYFERAIAEDPTLAPAYVGLADTYIARGFYPGVRPSEVMPMGAVLLEQALEIDHAVPRAHELLGLYRGMYEHDWEQARQELLEAVETAPHDSRSHFAYSAYYLTPTGRLDEALEEAQRARELDPLSADINHWLGRIREFRREYDLAAKQLLHTLELHPNYQDARYSLAVLHCLQGNYEEALATTASPSLQTWVLALQGKTDDAQEGLRQLEELSSKRYIQRYHFAYIHAALGEMDEALQWLDESYEEREPGLSRLKVDPRFDPLREDPRFSALLRKLNLGE